jgi:hypothetical protein
LVIRGTCWEAPKGYLRAQALGFFFVSGRKDNVHRW